MQAVQNSAVVNVSLENTATLPADVLSVMKGRDVSINVTVGDGISWSINGSTITDANAAGINLGVTVNTDAIPTNVVSAVGKTQYAMQFNLSHSGPFGFTGVLSMNIGDANAGKTANLYYYNPDANRLDFVRNGIVAVDGTVQYEFNHASDYLITIGENEASESPKTGEGAIPLAPIGMALGAVGLLLCVVPDVIAKRKRR